MPRRKKAPETAVGPADMEDWRAHSDAEALMRAEEVRADRARHTKAQMHLRKKAKEVARAIKPTAKAKSRRARLENVQL